MAAPRESLAEMPPILAVQHELRRGERAVWAARPVGGTGRRMAMARVRLGLFFTGFATFWVILAWAITRAGNFGLMGDLFPLFGIPFIAAGLFIIGSAAGVWRRLDSTVYGLSTERVFIISDRPRYQMKAVDLAALTGSERVEHADGVGDLALVDGHGAYGGKREWLFGVPDVARLSADYEKLRREAALQARAPREEPKPEAGST